MSFTLIYSDEEGWPVVERFKSEAEADEWVEEHLGPFEDGYNPAPQLIIGAKHEIKEYNGFYYC